MEYPDAYTLFLESILIYEQEKNELEGLIQYSNSLSEIEKDDKHYEFMQGKRKELINMIQKAYDLDLKSSQITLRYGLEGRPLEFLGWKAIDERTDSIYTYYLSKDYSELYGVQRGLKK